MSSGRVFDPEPEHEPDDDQPALRGVDVAFALSVGAVPMAGALAGWAAGAGRMLLTAVLVFVTVAVYGMVLAGRAAERGFIEIADKPR